MGRAIHNAVLNKQTKNTRRRKPQANRDFLFSIQCSTKYPHWWTIMVHMAKSNQERTNQIALIYLETTVSCHMIKYCNCIKLLSLTLRVNSLIFGPFISLISHSGRPLTIFHWWRQPAKGTLTRKKNQSIELFLHYNSVMVLNSYICMCMRKSQKFFSQASYSEVNLKHLR